MKKIKMNGKLCLNKETVSKLNDTEMKSINGGDLIDICPVTFGCPTITRLTVRPTFGCPTLNTINTVGNTIVINNLSK